MGMNSQSFYGQNGERLGAPAAVVAERDPANKDRYYELGQPWVNSSAQTVWYLVGFTAGNPVWYQAVGTGGAGTFTSLTVTTGPSDFQAGAFTVESGTDDINISDDAADTTVNVATGAGVKTLTVGSTNATSASTFQTGTGAMTFTAGGIFDANVTGAITLDTAANISLDSATASNFTVTGAADLTLNSSAGSTIVSGGEAADDALQLGAAAGGITAATAATKGIVLTSGAQTAGLYVGAGDPNGVVTAAQGSLYMNTAGSGVADRVWVNSDGATAWVNITTAS